MKFLRVAWQYHAPCYPPPFGVTLVFYFVLLGMGCRHFRDMGVDKELLDRMGAQSQSRETSDPKDSQLWLNPVKDGLFETSFHGDSEPFPVEKSGLLSDQTMDSGPPKATEKPMERNLSLEEAISEAFRNQPRLKAQLETIEQAKQGEHIAFAPFMPLVSTGYAVGAYSVGVGGIGIPVPGGGAFNFLPPGGTIPIGFNFSTGFELAEFRVQWLVTDFGKRLGRFRQAGITSEMVQLQTTRAFQTVSHEVTMAYYQLLRAKAIRKVSDGSVARCQEEADQAEKLAREGVVEREQILRAKVQLSTALKMQDSAQAAEQISLASLNLAMGSRAGDLVQVDSHLVFPEFNASLSQCLEQAVEGRREFGIARRSVDFALEEKGIARASFAPKVIADGFYLDYHQNKPGGFVDIPIGTIKLEWALFEGGKRIADLRTADSKIRAAQAQADALSDSIGFQVNEAYRLLVVSRRAIDRSKAPVEQTLETYRIVKARSAAGDAGVTELTEAETARTRAEQEYQTALFDYLMGLAKLEYAMGTTNETNSPLRAIPATNRGSHNPSTLANRNQSQEVLP